MLIMAKAKNIYNNLKKKLKKSSIQELLEFAEEDPKYMGIYMIYSTKEDKAYIGMSTNIPIRWENHKKDLIENKHHNKDLQDLFDKHGAKSLKYVVLEYCSKEKLENREKYFINKLLKESCINAEVTCIPTPEVAIDRWNNFRELLELMNVNFKERKDYFEVEQMDKTMLIYYPDTGRWKQKGKEKLYFSKSGVHFLKNYVLKNKPKLKR